MEKDGTDNSRAIKDELTLKDIDVIIVAIQKDLLLNVVIVKVKI